jgi:serine/threonine protein kinase
MTPIGKPLYEFSSFTELLSALRDAIIGHKRLYHTYHILHRDVSINNIVISPPGHTSAGVLIDLDLAIDINRLTKSGASHRTGTQDFMAVGVLEGEPHRARHDLESFFFVLLWIATFFDASANRRFDVSDTLFQTCNNTWAGGGSYKQVSMTKGSFVDRGTSLFERSCLAKMEDEVRAALGPLLEEWRSLLFPAQDEDALWDNMVVAVEHRLAALEKQELPVDDLGGAVSRENLP